MDVRDIISDFNPITLDEMKEIRLMNRTDTKFVTTKSKFLELLQLARDDYYAQEIDGRRIADYYTVYFDTPNYDMFRIHQCGHTNRQKLRIRCYVESKQSFLEIKTKNNHGRTKKKRMSMPCFDPTSPRYDIQFGGVEEQLDDCDGFLLQNLYYDIPTLSEKIENRFHRITLVNKGKTERLTIDMDLRFHNLVTDMERSLDGVVIIELKRDGLKPSPILNMLRQLRIKAMGFSKYCIGTAMTNSGLPQNRFKQRIRKIEKLNTQS